MIDTAQLVVGAVIVVSCAVWAVYMAVAGDMLLSAAFGALAVWAARTTERDLRARPGGSR